MSFAYKILKAPVDDKPAKSSVTDVVTSLLCSTMSIVICVFSTTNKKENKYVCLKELFPYVLLHYYRMCQ